MDVVEEAEEVNSMQEAFCIGDAEFIRHDPAVGGLVGLSQDELRERAVLLVAPLSMTKASRPWAPQSIRRCLASLLRSYSSA